tara:strand:+ start:201 stop:440 length:240 start_codon:yes stop_codon:yes gene_type:complete
MKKKLSVRYKNGLSRDLHQLEQKNWRKVSKKVVVKPHHHFNFKILFVVFLLLMTGFMFFSFGPLSGSMTIPQRAKALIF